MSEPDAPCDRQQLYDEVWEDPVTVVAERYGLSDVGLAKICRKLSIPVPTRGYWAKVKAGIWPNPRCTGAAAPWLLLPVGRKSEASSATQRGANPQTSARPRGHVSVGLYLGDTGSAVQPETGDQLPYYGGNPAVLCVVARTNALVEIYERGLRTPGFACTRLSRKLANNRAQEGVRLAALHRIKGLEFRLVMLAAVNDGVIPLPQTIENSEDPTERRAGELTERALFHVAVTRAMSLADSPRSERGGGHDAIAELGDSLGRVVATPPEPQ